jgi:outer membrane protein assembly factor BamB
MKTKPWYKTPAAIVAASVLLVAAFVGALIVTDVLPNLFVGSSDNEAHYSELERHRAEQRATAAEGTPAPDSAAPSSENAAPSVPTSDATAAVGKTAATSSRTYWTDYRGPNRDGRYEEAKILTSWPSGGLQPVWRQPVGGGYASFVVAEGHAFTIEQRRQQEVLAAYNMQTGRELWTHAWDASFVESMGGDGPRATPTWHEGRIYALGATGELHCVDSKTGKLIWKRNILKDNGAGNLEWGMSGAPLVVDDKVIVLPGGTSGKSVAAYNRLTGQPVWQSLNDKQGYVSPMLATLAGKRHIVVISSSRVVGLEVGDGSLVWEYPWNTSMGINCSQPIVLNDNRLFISSGYGKGAAVIELTRSGDNLTARTVWENTAMKNKFNSSVLHEGHIYGLDEGILTCVDVETGARKWKGGRYGYGQLLLASGHLIVLSDAGELALVKATPDQHTEVAKFSALEGKTWNYPALAGGRLLVRNATHMACYNLSGE